MSRPNPETILMHAIRAAVLSTGRAMLWRNNGGVARYGDAKVRYGIGEGSADLVGMLVPSGRFLAIEVKTERGRLSRVQAFWRDAVIRGGGVYLLARSVEEALAELAAVTGAPITIRPSRMPPP